MYKDEEIAEARYWERRKKYTGIETGIYSGEEFLEFSECYLFDKKVGIVLPITFKDMPPDEAMRKYHSEQRPQIIKTNTDKTVDFAFNMISEKMEPEQLGAAVNDFARVMKRLFPTNICLKIETGQGDYIPYASMEFTSAAINENMYNMLILSPVGDELLMTLFNCPYERSTEWSRCLLQIRDGIVDYSKEGKNEAN